jgi:hypothetical protein
MGIIAFMTEAPAVRQISRAWARQLHSRAWRRLASHRCGRCRCLEGPFDPQAQPAPDYEFDQRIAW